MIVTSEGDLGDLIYLACVIKHIPDGPHSLLIERTTGMAANKTLEQSQALVKMAGPLLEAQPYIKEMRMLEPRDTPDWRSGGFRPAGLHRTTDTLLNAHLNHYNAV